MVVETIDLNDLTPSNRNPRVRPERARELLRKSIEQFGLCRSIVVDKDLNVVAGNGTLEAAIECGKVSGKLIKADKDHLVIVRRSDLTEKQLEAYSVADNRCSELAEWDVDILIDLIDQLKDYDVGFTDHEIAGLKALQLKGGVLHDSTLTTADIKLEGVRPKDKDEVVAEIKRVVEDKYKVEAY